MSDEIKFNRVEDSEELFAKLTLLGAKRVLVCFDGSGDSGTINSTEVYGKNDTLLDLGGVTLQWTTEEDVFVHPEGKQLSGNWVRKNTRNEMPVADILENICYEALEHTSLDWYNNDGGFGEMEIDLTANPPTAKLQVNIRVTNHDENNFALTGLFKE